MRRRAQEQFGDAEKWRNFYKPLPFGRPGTTMEIAQMVAFLASDLAGYISGTVVTIDGGMASRGNNGA
jgi:NAD(P)-dependent dehydrogenase (short-subunit alcohol dehydrogenase family)